MNETKITLCALTFSFGMGLHAATYWKGPAFEPIDPAGIQAEAEAHMRKLFDCHTAPLPAKERAQEFISNVAYTTVSPEEAAFMSHQEKKALVRNEITHKAYEFLATKARLTAIELLKNNGYSEWYAVQAVKGIEGVFYAQCIQNYESKENVREVNGQLEERVRNYINNRLQ
jgi:hypothetical protein